MFDPTLRITRFHTITLDLHLGPLTRVVQARVVEVDRKCIVVHQGNERSEAHAEQPRDHEGVTGTEVRGPRRRVPSGREHKDLERGDEDAVIERRPKL